MTQFKGATCRGSYALGTACGRCERCKQEVAARYPAPFYASAQDEVKALRSAIADYRVALASAAALLTIEGRRHEALFINDLLEKYRNA